MAVAVYPAFNPLEKDDKGTLIEAFRKDTPEISEYTFTNLYTWREAYKLQISSIDGLIILKSGKDSLPRFFPPIGTGDKKAAILRILDETKGVFIRIPEKIKSLFDGNKHFNIQYDPDNSDYVFDVSDLVNLAGKKYDGKRNLIKQFKSAYKFDYVSLNSSNIKEFLGFEEKWCGVKDCDSIEGLKSERGAITETVNNFHEFDLIAGALYIGKAISAIAIGEKLNPDTLVLHFLKADSGINGLYQTALNEFLSHQAKGFKFVNMEQDLGVEGLRKTKLSYHPAFMIKKYVLKLNG